MSHHDGCYCTATNAPCSWCESLTPAEGRLLDRYGADLIAHAVSDHRRELLEDDSEPDPCPCRWCTGAVLDLECNCSRSWETAQSLLMMARKGDVPQNEADRAVHVAEQLRCQVQWTGRCGCAWCLVFGDDLHDAIRWRYQRLEAERQAREAADDQRRRIADRERDARLAGLFAATEAVPQRSVAPVSRRRPLVLPVFRERTPVMVKPSTPPVPAPVPVLAADRWELVEPGPAEDVATTYEPDDRWKVIDIGGGDER